MIQSRLGYSLTLAFLMVPVSAFADVVFTDDTFNLASYTPTSSFNTPGASIVGSQCASCGDPGNALQFVATFGDTTMAIGIADLGFVNNTFGYNPLVQGAIAGINASVDKNLLIDVTTPNTFGNTFRPLIEQDGNFYLAAIPGPGFQGGSTGFHTLSRSGLTATDFVQYDFSTNAFLSGHPNFSGDPILLGLGQISSIGGFTSSTVTAVYDNVSLTVVNTPEPASLWLFAISLPVLAAIGIARRRRSRLS